MLEILTDIRQRLKAGDYKNEEHVRLALVARIVQALGWNIWNPTEVYTEFKATPNEDVKRVDMALFADNLSEDAIFIECKGAGNLTKGLPDDLARVERQLRDYNKDNTAQLAIITNGRVWRFYYCYTSGEFASKHFKTLNLSEDDLEAAAEAFTLFLSKAAVADRSARAAAESYLTLTRKQQRMQDARPEAERRITQYPFPSLPDALVQVVAEQHTSVTRQEVESFLAGHSQPATLAGAGPLAVALPTPIASAPPAGSPRPPAATAPPKPRAGSPKLGTRPAVPAATEAPIARPAPPSAITLPQPAGEEFTLTQGHLHATAYLQPDGSLLVQAGSRAAATAAASLSRRGQLLRQELQDTGIVAPDGDTLVFTQHCSFSSANVAAEVIVARSVNAQITWKHPSGRQVRAFLK